MACPSDVELLDRARRGDPDGFEQLVRRYYRFAYLISLSVLGNRMDAEDACQEAFVRVLERLDQCQDPLRFAGWLRRVVRNHAVNRAAYRQVRRTLSLDSTDYAGPSDVPREVERRDLGVLLEAALARLSKVRREVVLLHDLEDLSHRSIAEILGISEGMSRQHLWHARRSMRVVLGEHTLQEYIYDR